MNNVTHDRDGGIETDMDGTQKRLVIRGESLAETANRIEAIISKPPPAPAPLTPMELRDPDAPEGWYEEPDVSGAWMAYAAQSGLADQLN